MDAKDITRRYHPHVKGWSEVQPHVAPFFGYVAAEKVRYNHSCYRYLVHIVWFEALFAATSPTWRPSSVAWQQRR
jgi:hypothetical protein